MSRSHNVSPQRARLELEKLRLAPRTHPKSRFGTQTLTPQRARAELEQLRARTRVAPRTQSKVIHAPKRKRYVRADSPGVVFEQLTWAEFRRSIIENRRLDLYGLLGPR